MQGQPSNERYVTNIIYIFMFVVRSRSMKPCDDSLCFSLGFGEETQGRKLL